MRLRLRFLRGRRLAVTTVAALTANHGLARLQF